MAVQLYNEGRVVGLSAYEVYVKHAYAEDPDHPPATEREWLASTMAMGSSMILRVPTVTQSDEEVHTFIDIQLPDGCMLAAANTIMASFFDGEVVFSGNWAKRVASYGDLISNNASASPSGKLGPTGTIPHETLSNWPQSKKDQLRDYMKIVDGIVIQPGTWSNSPVLPPVKDFTPDLTQHPRIRLRIKGSITHSPLVLLTGFTIRSVISGISGIDTSVNTANPDSGDFLGPATYPWANKIIFSVPSSYISFFASGNYQRSLPKTASAEYVNDTAIIDMQTTDPGKYYKTHHADARVAIGVEDHSTLGEGTAVLTVYQKKDVYPPALYATFVTATGDNYLNPLDIVAPGSVKMFLNASKETLLDYESTFPGTFAINKRTDGTIEIPDEDGDIVPMARVETSNLTYTVPANSGAGTNRAKKTLITTGTNKALVLSVEGSTAGSQVTISQKPSSEITLNSSNSYDDIVWSALLAALANNQRINILESRLKSLKQTLIKAESSSAGGCPYIEFGPETAKKRFYISSTEPKSGTGANEIPVGSIGIGWGLDNE